MDSPDEPLLPVTWPLVVREMVREPIDLMSLLLGRIESVPGLSNDERAICTDLALHATWISPSGTKARGRWPGYLRLGLSSEVGSFHSMRVVQGLELAHRMLHDEEEWVLDLLGPRWEAWRERDDQEQRESPTLPPSTAQLNWGDAHGMGAL